MKYPVIILLLTLTTLTTSSSYQYIYECMGDTNNKCLEILDTCLADNSCANALASRDTCLIQNQCHPGSETDEYSWDCWHCWVGVEIQSDIYNNFVNCAVK